MIPKWLLLLFSSSCSVLKTREIFDWKIYSMRNKTGRILIERECTGQKGISNKINTFNAIYDCVAAYSYAVSVYKGSRCFHRLDSFGFCLPLVCVCDHDRGRLRLLRRRCFFSSFHRRGNFDCVCGIRCFFVRISTFFWSYWMYIFSK